MQGGEAEVLVEWASDSYNHVGEHRMTTKDQVAKELIEWHFQVEPGLSVVFRVLAENEEDPNEPIKLIEVNTQTVATGSFEPFRFAPTEDTPFPTVIAELTPEEFRQFRSTPGAIPESWDIDGAQTFKRGAA